MNWTEAVNATSSGGWQYHQGADGVTHNIDQSAVSDIIIEPSTEGTTMNWQPIETAPKDGTVILLHVPTNAPRYRCLVAFWESYQTVRDGVVESDYTGWTTGFRYDRDVLASEWAPIVLPGSQSEASAR